MNEPRPISSTVSAKPFAMCSVHRLLLNCILFFHLAPQLTLWSGHSHGSPFEIDRRNGDACGSHLDHIHLDPLIERQFRLLSSFVNYDHLHCPNRQFGYDEVTPYQSQFGHNLGPKSNVHRSPKAALSLDSPSASSLPVNSASDHSSDHSLDRSFSSPADRQKAFIRSKASNFNDLNDLSDSNDNLNQKSPSNQKPSYISSQASSFSISSQASSNSHASSISSVIKQSDNCPDFITSALLNLRFSALSMLSELIVHSNVKADWSSWINRPVGAHASSDIRAHRKFGFFYSSFLLESSNDNYHSSQMFSVKFFQSKPLLYLEQSLMCFDLTLILWFKLFVVVLIFDIPLLFCHQNLVTR